MPRRGTANHAITTYVDPDLAEQVSQVTSELKLSDSSYLRMLVAQDITKRTREAQGLPNHVEDAATLRRIADVFLEASVAS